MTRSAWIAVGLGFGLSFMACGSADENAGGAGSEASATSSGCAGAGCAAPEVHHGDGTYYDADGSGNCSFDPTGDLMVAAMNHADYADSAACGACVEATGPAGSVTLRVVDQCPECSPGDIDMSPEAFARLAALEEGRVPITWTYVPCEVEGPIVYHFKEGSNPYWTAVQIRNARSAIAKVEARRDDGTLVTLTRQTYNYFIYENGLGAGPYSFRVTDVHGQVIEDTGVPFVEDGDATGAAQLPRCAP